MRHINLASFDTLRKVITTAGMPEILSPKYTAATIAFNNNGDTADTITDSASQFVVEGFRAGDVINITGSTSNNVQVTVATVAAGTLTLTKSGILTTEVAGDAVTLDLLHGRKVEDGVAVTIKALSSNTGTITLGPTSARALSSNTNYDSNFSLLQNQSVSLQVKNLKDIWMDATVSGEGVQIAFEK